MTVSIFDHQLPNDSHNLYDVSFYSDNIHTLVTQTPSMVSTWLVETYQIHQSRPHRLIVGLDVEWRPSFNSYQNPVATLQLCVDSRCLIFQLIHAPTIPTSLVNFLGDASVTFVGVGIESDVERLLEDYGLGVANAVDLRVLAAEELGVTELRNAGLKGLVMEVLGKELTKPKRVTMSRWDNMWLSHAQVQYACLDAFLSSEIGKCLNAAG
jgi:ribonuclease D